MGYDIKDKVEWTVIFVMEFGRRHGLDMTQAFNYLSRFGAIKFIESQYAYVHTQSFSSIVDDMTEYCRRKGGTV